MKSKVLILTVALMLLATLAAGCGAAPTPEMVEKEVVVEKKVVETVVVEKEVPVEKEVVKVVEKEVVVERKSRPLRVGSMFFLGNGDMAELDPPRRGTWGFGSLLWAPLVAGDTAGTPMPDKSLAPRFDVSDDGKVYTFYLRPEAKFSDATPITAQHVADTFGYYRMMAYKEAKGIRDNYGTAKRLYFDIVGLMDSLDAGDYDQFGVGEPMEGVKALDDHTLQVTLTEPSVSFIPRLTAGFAVFNPADLAEYAGDILDYWPAHAVYSGPYKLTEAVPGEKFVMVPNEHYFGPKPQIPEITVFAVSEDMNTVLTAFTNRELDVLAVPIRADTARQALDDPYLKSAMVEVPAWQVHQLWITPNVPLDDVHVRRAISMALDRDKLVKILNAGAPVELYRVVNMHRSPAVPHCIEETAAVKPLPFDPEKAKEELKKSKYWPDVVDMEINCRVQNPFATMVMEVLQQMLQQNLGLTNITLRTEEIPDMMNPPYPLHLWTNTQQPWYADITDTLRNMAFFIRDKEWEADEHRAFIDVAYIPELRDLVEASIVENDPVKRCDLVAKAGQVWNDDVFSLDYAIPVDYFLIAPWVKGDFNWYENAGQGKPLTIENVFVEEPQ